MAKVKLLDFWASWCGPCKIMDPVIDEIEAELKGQFELVKVNADEEGEMVAKYGVMGLPSYIILKDEVEVARKVGITPKVELVKLLEQ